MTHWMLFSTLAAGLFYGLYCLTLRRDRWLELSLWYLLVALPFSILVPHLSMHDFLGFASLPVVPAGNFWLTLDEVDITASEAPRALALMDGVLATYLVGLTVCVAWLVYQLAAQAVAVVRLRRKHGVHAASDGYDIPRRAALVLVDDDTAPYSFFNQIIVGTRGLNDEDLRCILAHESLHVRHHHTSDLLFARLLCCMAWFNPFAWLMLRELRAVHEYQADAAVLADNGRMMIRPYMSLLYRQATGTGYGHITNKFNSINLKKRINMMKQTKSRFGAWKALAALPVAALLLMVGCKPAEAQKGDGQTAQQEVIAAATGDSIYEVVEVQPEFPGGMEALYKYLAENIHYPEQAKADKVEGRVYVRFVIEADGSVNNAEVLRGIGGGCDEEALRVVNAMPKWTPGKQRGEVVRVHFNLPIIFKLQ